MKAKRIWLVAGVLLAALVIRQYESQSQQLGALRTEISDLREQQVRLAQQAARPPVIVRTQVAATVAPSVQDSPPAPAAPQIAASDRIDDPVTAAQRWEEETRASLAAVEGAFVAEPVDGAWATAARSTLQDRLSAVSRISSSSLGAIDCKSSTCRVEVEHRNGDAWRQFAETAFASPEGRAWNGSVVILPPQTTSSGSLLAVMYLGREVTDDVSRSK